jgi:hemerythrin-like metal-binding protein
MGLYNELPAIHTNLPLSLLVGVPSIDKEHDVLVGQLEKLVGNPDTDTDAEIFSETLSQLGSQLNEHFTHEEQIFKSLGMPESLVFSHVQAHTKILDQYANLLFDLTKGKVRNRAEVLLMIKEWIVGHVVCHDLVIKKYLPASRLPEPEANISTMT